ncbi:hypothetical protein IKG54_01805, partial [Candidatus Saccharibacteria bacterium]|nr:hypothetical protein [Candidatus Saccharibacteria bacterium]
TQDTEPTSNTTIYYGVKAGRDIPAGSYSNTVLYTALAEQPSEIRVCVTNSTTGAVTCGDGGATTPTIDLSSPNQPVTIYTSISTTAEEVSEATATVSFYRTAIVDGVSTKVEEGTCTSPTINLDSDNFLNVSCTSPNLGVGSYTVELTLTHFGRVLAETNAITYTGEPLIEDITTMQQMTANICNNLPYGTTDGHNIYTLKDSRDNKSYKIAHLADGNCWMVQNLALDGGRTLHPSDSNVTQDRVLPPNIANGDTSAYNTAQVLSYNSDATDIYGSKVGNHYNWSAITATIGKDTTETTINESLCSSGWRNPDAYGNKSYSRLISLYNDDNGNPIPSGYTDGSAARAIYTRMIKAPLFFPYNGNYASILGNQQIGFYWTRTYYGYDNTEYQAYLMVFYGAVYDPQSHLAKWQGFGIRCVFDS